MSLKYKHTFIETEEFNFLEVLIDNPDWIKEDAGENWPSILELRGKLIEVYAESAKKYSQRFNDNAKRKKTATGL